MKNQIIGKLVRDKLEKPIKVTYPQATFKYLKDKELEDALRKKLVEEVTEFLEANTQENKGEEAGDVFEVLECLLELYSIDINDVFLKKAEKTKSKGSFKKGVYWIES